MMIDTRLTSPKAIARFGNVITIRRAAFAGILGPVLFALGIGLGDILNYRYLVATGNDPLTQSPVSVNACGPYGWIQIVTFIVFGLCLLVFAVGLHRGVRRGKGAWLGIGLLMSVGVAMVLSGSPMDCNADGNTTTLHGQIHEFAFWQFFFSKLLMYFFMAWRFRQDPRWRGYDWYSLATGLLVLPLFISFGALPPIFSWFYLGLLVTPLAWVEATAFHLWLLSRRSAEEFRPA
jgi:hypothetical protein